MMNRTQPKTEVRQVSGFDQVAVRGNTCSAQLLIKQGAKERLTIEAPADYLGRLRSEVKNGKLTIRLAGGWFQELRDAISIGLNWPTIIYRLEVRELKVLDVYCAYFVDCSRLETPNLQIRLNGTGDLRLDELQTQTLRIHHSGAGSLQIAGQVEDQTIVIHGIGSYMAPDLASKKARVRMSGTGLARVQVQQELDVTLRGVGMLEYSGNPAVNQRISGPGQIRRIVDVRQTFA